MDDKTFDSLLKLTATSTGRRRLLQAAGAAGIGGLLTRGVAGAQEMITEACQNRGTKCSRNRQCECNNGDKFNKVTCDTLARGCKSGQRCCGKKGATCGKDCDCCTGYHCNRNKRECVRGG